MYLHTGNHKPETTFHDSDCIKEWIYVDGLKEGSYLSSDSPYLLQKDNGVIVSLDQSYSMIYHKDQHDEIIETINLNFITTCSNSEKTATSIAEDAFLTNTSNFSYFPTIIVLFAVLLLGFVFIRFLVKKV